MVKADDHAEKRHDAIARNARNHVARIEARHLALVDFVEALFAQGFEPQENDAEAGIRKQLQKLLVSANLHRSLRTERQRPVERAVPGDDFVQKLEGEGAVDEEIVVREEDGLGAAGMRVLHFAQDLLDCLRTKLTSHQPYDIAKIAIVGTAATGLNRKVQVVAAFDERQIRRRALLEIDEFFLLIKRRCLACQPLGKKARPDFFGLA